MNYNKRNGPVNIAAFTGFVRFLLGKDDAIEQFTTDTGITLSVPRSPIEAAIDEVTGAGRAQMTAFAEWVASEYWGADDAPDIDLVFKPEPDGRLT